MNPELEKIAFLLRSEINELISPIQNVLATTWSVGPIPIHTRRFWSPGLGTWGSVGIWKIGYKTILHIIGSSHTDCA